MKGYLNSFVVAAPPWLVPDLAFGGMGVGVGKDLDEEGMRGCQFEALALVRLALWSGCAIAVLPLVLVAVPMGGKGHLSALLNSSLCSPEHNPVRWRSSGTVPCTLHAAM